jgi:hypothetical protein
MKKYFAKYLPVEGEIKSDDTALTKYVEGVTEVTKEEYYKNGGNEIFPVGNVTSDRLYVKGHGWGTYFDREECQKVKLCLCSRDIQVGDVVKDSLDTSLEGIVKNITGDKLSVEIDGEIVFVKTNEVLKVIGEISSEASWVLKGDEFDRPDWEYESALQDDVNLQEDDFIRIKGPCGHFH